MKHSVIFRNVDNHWDNALPLGNGCYGTMLYFEDGTLYMPVNHYEVYYNVSDTVLPSATEKEDLAVIEDARVHLAMKDGKYGGEHAARRAMADGNVPPEGEPFCEYRRSRAHVKASKKYGIDFISGSHPMTGDVSFSFAPALSEATHTLMLDVEDASVKLALEKGKLGLSMRTTVLREDCILNEIDQSEAGLLKEMEVSFAPYRDLDPPRVHFEAVDENTLVYTVTRPLKPSGKPFVFSGILRLVGAKMKVSFDTYTAKIEILDAKDKISVLTGVFTDWRYADTKAGGLEKMNVWEKTLPSRIAEHAAYWKAFFERATIHLPDEFLENVYYINLYALDCCSGRDGVMKHHACGLNGLWDIKHPNIWGSMWYWDVNIQASFAGVFTSNRLELAKVFSDGLRSYLLGAERYALELHGLSGAAIDYPYAFYYCDWPWSAQYLWFLYEYSQDKEYLKNDAYPLFMKLCEFCLGLFEWDDSVGYYRVYPDISPEQGPLAHDTTSTVASVKYLLRFTMEAAKILNDDDPMLAKIQNLYDNLPPYAVAKDGLWGTPFKDSPDAYDNMWVRHPGILMPIFPTGEIDPLVSDKEKVKIASDTVDFVFDRSELGIFQGSWLAASAARLGRGNDAIRALYERGIDHMLRSNGLTAEETERFMNYCLIGRQPLYYPCMMEFTGEMLAAVGEMLLGSHNGIIRVFQAIPDGKQSYADSFRYGYPLQESKFRYAEYPAWRDVSFDKLLTKGAFEISAALCDGKLSYIKVHSKAGGRVRLTSPFLTKEYKTTLEGESVDAVWEDGILAFETKAGETYLVSLTTAVAAPMEREESTGVLTRLSATKRTVYIGEDEDTAYHRALDAMTRDWYIGNLRQSNHPLYKFDMGASTEKDYGTEFPEQVYVDPGRTMNCSGFLPIVEETVTFTPKLGYGFENAAGIVAVDRGAPDLLRRDFVEGTEPATFVIDAPRGQYELFVVSGDSKEESATILSTENGYTFGGELIAAGRYQFETVPLLQKRDRPIRLSVSTLPGKKWKLNLIILNVRGGY